MYFSGSFIFITCLCEAKNLSRGPITNTLSKSVCYLTFLRYIELSAFAQLAMVTGEKTI